MKNVKRWVPVVAAAGMLVGAGVAGAFRPAPVVPMAAPVTIGVVRLGVLMDGLQETKDRGAELEQRGQAFAAELAQLREQIKTLQAQIDAGTVPADQRLAVLQDIGEKKVLADARQQGYNARWDIARGDIMRAIYQKIVATSQQFARLNGYDMILVDDRSFAMAPEGAPTSNQLESIQRRRVLFATDSLDVTDQILTLMNNQYRAGGAANSGGGGNP